ncbi:hypothetical protein [Pseudonocardia nigra]|uniref:hypothetical protein n=1 Tax=Pseudonocardia nigra TaxID=1921578 RepID=UPI001C5F0A76|nr:hypothetical protein [Pseudonocardia nigra]
MATTHARVLNLGLQLAAIRHAFPAAIGHVQRGKLICTVPLQPTAASRTYTVRLSHRHGKRPQVEVIGPQLELHPEADRVPHVYPGDHLCLYYGREWNDSLLLAHTVLPWASEWLLYYELWIATGTWHGGGTTH